MLQVDAESFDKLHDLLEAVTDILALDVFLICLDPHPLYRTTAPVGCAPGAIDETVRPDGPDCNRRRVADLASPPITSRTKVSMTSVGQTGCVVLFDREPRGLRSASVLPDFPLFSSGFC